MVFLESLSDQEVHVLSHLCGIAWVVTLVEYLWRVVDIVLVLRHIVIQEVHQEVVLIDDVGVCLDFSVLIVKEKVEFRHMSTAFLALPVFHVHMGTLN